MPMVPVNGVPFVSLSTPENRITRGTEKEPVTAASVTLNAPCWATANRMVERMARTTQTKRVFMQVLLRTKSFWVRHHFQKRFPNHPVLKYLLRGCVRKPGSFQRRSLRIFSGQVASDIQLRQGINVTSI